MTEKKIFSNSNYINELKESFNKNGFLYISPLFSKDCRIPDEAFDHTAQAVQ